MLGYAAAKFQPLPTGTDVESGVQGHVNRASRIQAQVSSAVTLSSAKVCPTVTSLTSPAPPRNDCANSTAIVTPHLGLDLVGPELVPAMLLEEVARPGVASDGHQLHRHTHGGQAMDAHALAYTVVSVRCCSNLCNAWRPCCKWLHFLGSTTVCCIMHLMHTIHTATCML